MRSLHGADAYVTIPVELPAVGIAWQAQHHAPEIAITCRPLIPAAVCHSYVDSECYYFALTLRRMTGLPMLEVGNLRADGHCAGGHVLVEFPAGKIAS